jgi:hypothetical protein
MTEVPMEEIGRAFGPVGVLQVMTKMTCKARGKGKGEVKQQSFAFDYYGVDPGHVVGDADETIETDALTLAEFDAVIARCDEQIVADIEANKLRKGLRDDVRPIFRSHPDIRTIGEAIAVLVREPEPA